MKWKLDYLLSWSNYRKDIIALGERVSENWKKYSSGQTDLLVALWFPFSLSHSSRFVYLVGQITRWQIHTVNPKWETVCEFCERERERWGKSKRRETQPAREKERERVILRWQPSQLCELTFNKKSRPRRSELGKRSFLKLDRIDKKFFFCFAYF